MGEGGEIGIGVVVYIVSIWYSLCCDSILLS